MIKVTFHIENENEYMDKEVCKDIMLQCLPRPGDRFWMSRETEEQFYNTIHENNLYGRYDKWLYGKSYKLSYKELCSCDKEILKEDFYLDDVCIVKNILFKDNGEIHIELSDDV